MKKFNLATSSTYRTFVSDRDKILEDIHRKNQLRISDALGRALDMVTKTAHYRFYQNTDAYSGKKANKDFEIDCDRIFELFIPYITETINRAFRNAYVFSSVSEVEAIGRALRKQQKYDVKRADIRSRDNQDSEGNSLYARVHLALSRIKRDIVDAFQTSITLSETPEEGMIRLKKSFPKAKIYKRAPKILRPVTKMTEADKKDFLSYSDGVLDENEWQDFLDDYKQDYVPSYRAPEYVTDVEAAGYAEEWYGWEIEQELTQGFVEQVRDGQIDAANNLGINDFIWIAVIDSVTDECCKKRDNLTTKEIESKLKSEWKEDDCSAVTPPAHFNCRCTIAPISDDFPSEEPLSASDINDWIYQ